MMKMTTPTWTTVIAAAREDRLSHGAWLLLKKATADTLPLGPGCRGPEASRGLTGLTCPTSCSPSRACKGHWGCNTNAPASLGNAESDNLLPTEHQGFQQVSRPPLLTILVSLMPTHSSTLRTSTKPKAQKSSTWCTRFTAK